jgi:predicted transcriptional regulator of viral defense system
MPNADNTIADRALEIAARHGIARARDFTAAGIAPLYIKQLTEEGRLIRLGRGLYQLPETAGTDINHDLAEVSKRAPGAVVCLLSALRFHELTTQLPPFVWLMIPHKARAPRIRGHKLEIVRASSSAVLREGVVQANIEGVLVPITNPAKTVADCFKYRSRVGLDVAIEALQEYLRKRKGTRDELARYAAIDRVAAVMRPYMEALT